LTSRVRDCYRARTRRRKAPTGRNERGRPAPTRDRHALLRFALGGTVLIFATAVGLVARAGNIPGGGDRDPTVDCLIEADVGGVETGTSQGKATRIECTDCDPTCDRDGVTETNGSCTFEVGTCANLDNVQGCTPAALDPKKTKALPKKLGVPVPSDLSGVPACTPANGGFGEVVVKLKKKGKKEGTRRLVLKAATTAKPRTRDTDRLRLVCKPQTGECPSALTTTTTSTTATTTSTTTTTLPLDPAIRISGQGGTNPGTSVVVGGPGAQEFRVEDNAFGYWTITGDGGDTLSFAALTQGITIDLGDQAAHQQVRPGLFILLQDTFSLVIGSEQADSITGDGLANTIRGGGGGDTLDGAGGADTVFGGADGDTMSDTDTSDDTLYGGGDVEAEGCGTAGTDNISSNSTGIDLVFGGNLNDGTTCADGADVITTVNDASTNGDTIFGGNWNVNGGNGDDGVDDINVGSDNSIGYGGNRNSSGGSGNDAGDPLDVVSPATGVTLYGGNQNNPETAGNDGDDSIDGGNDADVLYGGNQNWPGSTGSDGSDTIGSTNQGLANDLVFGGNENLGGTGSDTGGDDISAGGDVHGGNDNSFGGTGDDGNDTINTFGGADEIYGGNRNRTGGGGNDGGDSIDSGTGADLVYGGNRNVSGAGDDGNDTIDIADGETNDTAYGDNRGLGGQGSDVISSDGAPDTVSTGNG
jgi:hypothetical protein